LFCPDDTPQINIREIAFKGANTYTVNGLDNDCGKVVSEGNIDTGWFDAETWKNPIDYGRIVAVIQLLPVRRVEFG